MVTCHPNAFFSAQPIVDVGGFLVVAFTFVISFQPGLFSQCSLHGTEIREELVGLAEMKQITEFQTGGGFTMSTRLFIHPYLAFSLGVRVPCVDFMALRMAEEHEADLVEISPNAVPPVCRIIDYSKFLYQLKKRAKEQKAKQVKVNVKEIRFGPQTDEHDYNFKLKHAIGFLQDGDKVKAYVFFKGRSILFKEQGEVLLLRFANDLEEYAKVEQMPLLEGKRMTISLAPKKAAAPKKPAKPEAPKAEKKD